MEHELKQRGENESFSTGSRRDTREGRGRFDLILVGMPDAFRQLAILKEDGAKKYDDHNWRKGQQLSRYFDSAVSHLTHVAQGHEDENHIIQAAWNCMALAQTLVDIRSGRTTADMMDLPYAMPGENQA